MGIFSTKKKEELVLLFDIGSSSVGGALFYLQEKGVPRIIYTIREPIILEKKIDIERFSTLTIEALKTVSTKICMKGLGAPNRIFCILSSPWCASQTRLIKLNQEVPVTFTDKLADELIAKELKIFEAEHTAMYLDDDNMIEVIELKNIKTTLNGYDTLNPVGQKAKEIIMSVFISIAEKHFLAKIKENISRHFRTPNLRFSSFMIASFAVARDTFINQENFLLVNIGGEVTDISMIKKDIIRESVSFPLGHNFMVRGVAEGIGCSLDEARAFLSLYRNEHASESSKSKLEPVISLVKAEWLKNFQEFLSNLTSDISIPSVVFITIDKDLAKFFSEIIKTEQFNQYILTESKFKVIFLGAQDLHGIALFEENTSHDPFLIIESIYINRFLR